MSRLIPAVLIVALAATTTPCASAKADERAAVAPVTVAILMFDGVQIIDFAAPYEVFGQAHFSVFTVSRDGQPVTTAMDLGVSVDHSFATAPPADVVVIPGGNVDATSNDVATLAWIRSQSEHARQVFSICTGSDILAATGLLDGHSATTFHKHFEHMQHRFPKVDVVRDQRWVESGKLITSAGLASGMDAALQVVANLRGRDAARSVAMHLEYPWSPEQGFVRGLMADQFIRLPEQDLTFPQGTDIRRLSSLGNETYWEITFEVTSPLSPPGLLQHIGTQARLDKALSVLPLPDDMQLAWQYESERGGHWRISYQAFEPADDGAFRVVMKVARLY